MRERKNRYHDSASIDCGTISKCIDVVMSFYPQPLISCQCASISLGTKNGYSILSKIRNQQMTDNKSKLNNQLIYVWDITRPICFIKSIITGRVPIPVDQTTMPYRRYIPSILNFFSGNLFIWYSHNHCPCFDLNTISLEFFFCKSSNSFVKPVVE